MSKHREQSLRNRSDILRKCYPLVATGSWDAIAISDIEKVIKQTRGAIAYYFKNKKTLFANILDELFFPVFALSDDEREKLSKATVSDFYNRYKTTDAFVGGVAAVIVILDIVFRVVRIADTCQAVMVAGHNRDSVIS